MSAKTKVLSEAAELYSLRARRLAERIADAHDLPTEERDDVFVQVQFDAEAALLAQCEMVWAITLADHELERFRLPFEC